MKEKLKSSIFRFCSSVINGFGFILIPIAHIENMEQDSAKYYTLKRFRKYASDWDKGYINGIVDCESKMAITLRERFIIK